MNPKLRRQLISLNQTFYANVYNSFSKSRQYSWAGWEQAFEFLSFQDFNPANILDVGCGNGRFVSFLSKKLQQFSYLGIDNSQELLNKARNSRLSTADQATIDFRYVDITNAHELNEFQEKYDLIVMMAVLHHIPGVENRRNLLKTVVDKLRSGGILIFTTWNFLDEQSLKKKIAPWGLIGMDKSDLDKGDYLLDWNSDNNLLRYCHYFNPLEIDQLIHDLPAKAILRFDSDGRNGRLNTYVLLEKE